MGQTCSALAVCALVAVVCNGSWGLTVPPLVAPRLTLERDYMPGDVQANPATATDQKPTSPAPSNYGITGSWFGMRDQMMREAHISFGGMMLLDVAKNLRGGLDTESWPVRSLVDLHAVVDADAMGLLGGTGYVDFQWHEESGNRDTAVGDLQAYDNLEGPRYVAFAQLWYRQAVGDFRLKVGRIDANTDAAVGDAAAHDAFSFLNHGLMFIHSAAAYAPTTFAMPTYPNPAPGVELFYSGEEGPYVGFGAFYANSRTTFLNISGHPEAVYPASGGMFFIGETGTWWKLEQKVGHAGVGGWYHSGEFARTATPSESSYGAGGAYLLVDQTIYLEEPEGAPPRDIGVFFTAGWADPTTSQMSQSLTLGLSATGFVPCREGDTLGVMTSWVHLPGESGLEPFHTCEWATEVFYNIQVLPWASVRPAFDYVVSPSGVHPDAAVAMVRIEIGF